jgi:phosphopantothenoylcysteine decarboxylase/phosphopantothenate--cysteine ligase
MATILITAGPTREYIDDVRYLSNGSSGRMGCALAEAALATGHEAIMVLGPVEVTPPPGAVVLPVVSALEMQTETERAFATADVAIAAAAVSDYRPADRMAGKPPRAAERIQLELVPNPDIVAGLAMAKGARIVVGFALESASAGFEAAITRGRDKLQRKRLDLIVINLHDAIGEDASEAVLCFADGRLERLPHLDKRTIALRIVAAAVDLFRGEEADA